MTGDGPGPKLGPLYDEAIWDTVERSEATGSPAIRDDEQMEAANVDGGRRG